jgi:hypothetical protein
MPTGFENFFGEAGILVDNEENFSLPYIDIIEIMKIVRIADEKYGLRITTVLINKRNR